MPQEDPIELFRSQDPGALKHVATVLDDAEIAHQLITDEGGFDITSIGAGGDSEKGKLQSNFLKIYRDEKTKLAQK